MKPIGILLFVTIFSCSSQNAIEKLEDSSPSPFGKIKENKKNTNNIGSIIKTEMNFNRVEKILALHKAKSTSMQFAYPNPLENRRIEAYILSDDRTVVFSLARQDQGAPWLVKKIEELFCNRPCKKNSRKWINHNELNLK